jgi:hypothetical protein
LTKRHEIIFRKPGMGKPQKKPPLIDGRIVVFPCIFIVIRIAVAVLKGEI